MLWLVFVYIVVKVSINNFKESYNYFSIMTLFIIMGMFSRSFVDTNMRDHVFLQYMIILGISLFFMNSNESPINDTEATCVYKSVSNIIVRKSFIFYDSISSMFLRYFSYLSLFLSSLFGITISNILYINPFAFREID